MNIFLIIDYIVFMILIKKIRKFYNGSRKLVKTQTDKMCIKFYQDRRNGIMVEVEMNNGKINGKYKKYDPDGVLIMEGYIDRKSNKIGRWIYYHQSGDIYKTGLYNLDKENGEWLIYENDKIVDRLYYVDGDCMNFKNVDNPKQDCSICIDTSDKKKLYIQLDCDHIFHGLCISKWIEYESKPNCPLCRKEI